MKVTIQNNNECFECSEGESILEAGLRQHIAMPYGCQSGSCGDCIGILIDGDIEYPDGPPPALDDNDIAADKVLFCQARAKTDLTIDVKVIDTHGGMKPRKISARVANIEKLTESVVRLRLKIPATERLQFFAGQYVDFILDDGRRRAFSLANSPYHDEFLEFQIRYIPGGYFTSLVFKELKENALVRIEGPFGTFHLREGDDHNTPMIMMAGGTGMAPIRSMLLHMFDTHIDRPVHLFWGVRTEKDIYLQGEINHWLTNHPQLQFTAVLSEPESSGNWQGEVGWVHEAVVRNYPDLSGHEVYMSGPPSMVRIAKDAFHQCGLPEDRMFSDTFDFANDPEISAAEKGGGQKAI